MAPRFPCSWFLPVGQCHQFVENILQSLKPTFVISRCAECLLLAAMQVQSIRFADLRYFLSQYNDAFFDRILHDDRLAELHRAGHSIHRSHSRRSRKRPVTPLNPRLIAVTTLNNRPLVQKYASSAGQLTENLHSAPQ
jgi:hypothetical protein